MPDDTTLRTTIELKGEQQYRAAMAEINRQLRETKSALSAAAAEFANADAATRTSTAQADALTQSLDQQRERLELMQAQLEKVEEKYGKNSKAAVELRTKINNARAEMARTEGQLRALSDGLNTSADAAQSAGEDMGGAAKGFDDLGDSAQRAQDDVRSLAGEIGSVVGRKLIEFEVGKKALEQLAAGFKWALGEAISGQAEDAHARALAGDSELTARRTTIKDAVDREWAGRRDGMQTVSDVAAVDTALGNAGITDDARVTKLTNWAITIDEVFGQGVQDTIDRATAMVNTFGVSWETAIDLMTKGQRDMSDGGAQMLAAFEDYGQAYKQLGYDIDDMYSAIAAAANDSALGKDSNLNKGVENFINNLTSGSKESTETLAALGVEITDLPRKFQQGGAAAAEATQMILTKLQSITDEAKRNDLGKALFGDKIWTDSAGQIANVLLAGFNQTVDAAGATADAMKSELDTLDDAWAQTGERASQEFSQAAAPIVDAAKDALQTLNKNADETGSLMGGLVKSVKDANEQVATDAAQAFDSAKESYQDWARGLAEDVASGRWLDDLKEKNAEAAQVAEQTNQTVEAQRAELDRKLAEINQAITDADIAGNYAEAARLTQERDQIISDIAQMAAEVKDNYTRMGEDAADAVEKQGPKMQSAADSMGQQGVNALFDLQPDMMDAGDLMGSAGSLGAQAGLGDGYDIGENFGAAVASGIRSQKENVRSAASELARAGSGAARTTFQINSPSRVGLDTGENYGGAVAEGIRRRQEDVREASAMLARAADEQAWKASPEGSTSADAIRAQGSALAETFTGGYGARGTFKSPDTEALNTQTGISSTELVEALREALSGLAWETSVGTFARLAEPEFSRASQQRVQATVRGSSARAKGW